MLNLLNAIDWADKSVGLLIGVFQAVIIAIITGYLINKAFIKQKAIGSKLSTYGIDKVSIHTGTLRPGDVNVLFGMHGHVCPVELKLCFITGNAFFRDYELNLKHLVENGTKVKVLLGDPDFATFSKYYAETLSQDKYIDKVTDYYMSIYFEGVQPKTFLEREFVMLTYNKLKKFINEPERENFRRELKSLISKDGDDVYQVFKVAKRLEAINAYARNGGGIEVRYYTDEYQMPIILARFVSQDGKHGSNGKTLLWTNMNAPIKETSESINIHCVRKADEEAPYVDDTELSFDYLFEHYKNSKIDTVA